MIFWHFQALFLTFINHDSEQWLVYGERGRQKIFSLPIKLNVKNFEKSCILNLIRRSKKNIACIQEKKKFSDKKQISSPNKYRRSSLEDKFVHSDKKFLIIKHFSFNISHNLKKKLFSNFSNPHRVCLKKFRNWGCCCLKISQI